MLNPVKKTVSMPKRNSKIGKTMILTKLTELLYQESMITPDEKVKLLNLIRKEKDL